jgi:hypothetical protein
MTPPPINPYHVSYSGRVRDALRNLLVRASGVGRGAVALAAVREIDRRLRIYPHFGEPLRDLITPGETDWIGTVDPLVVQYIIDEPHRAVFVIVPIKAIPGCGFV